jgi:hypothetical protein
MIASTSLGNPEVRLQRGILSSSTKGVNDVAEEPFHPIREENGEHVPYLCVRIGKGK